MTSDQQNSHEIVSRSHIGNPRRLLTKRTPPHSEPALGPIRSLERCRWCLLGESRDHRPRTYIVHPRSEAQGRAAQLNAAQLRVFFANQSGRTRGRTDSRDAAARTGPKPWGPCLVESYAQQGNMFTARSTAAQEEEEKRPTRSHSSPWPGAKEVNVSSERTTL